MINWPSSLVSDIARRKSVLVIGAGVSKNSTNSSGLRPKDWKEFLVQSSDHLSGKAEINRQIKSGDFLTACELIKKELGRDDFNTLVKEEFLNPRFNHAKIHQHIYNLDSRIVITPNFDKIYDTYANTTSQGSIIIKKFYEEDIIDCIRRPEPLIIKIHGSVDSTDNLIFTRKDYSEARTKYRNFYQIIEALSLTHTFIFIGCGTNDPDIRLLLEDFTFKYPLNKQHYIIMPSNALNNKVKEIVKDTMSLKILEYDSSNYHKLLTDSLAELVTEVELKRQEIANLQSW
ncbi:SIR2 family protein [uncultured Chryseobacterium sp.]|uniref:SIR2 family protein n=1 Tax=uncultured Chryseobacterium sp. TaxID=259322 RepID=UPI0025DD767B|nr:SIR2 family protein [uncultured Chryseobacterium sp.]